MKNGEKLKVPLVKSEEKIETREKRKCLLEIVLFEIGVCLHSQVTWTDRLHGNQASHMVATSNHQPQQLHGNTSRFPDFLDTLPASNVDFAAGSNPVPHTAWAKESPIRVRAVRWTVGELVPHFTRFSTSGLWRWKHAKPSRENRN